MTRARRSVTAYRINRLLTSALACRGEIRYDTGKRDQRLDRLKLGQTSRPRSLDRADRKVRGDAIEVRSFKGTKDARPERIRGGWQSPNDKALLGSAGEGHPQ